MGQRRYSGVTLIFQVKYMTDEKHDTKFPLGVAIPRVEFFGPDMNHLNITLCVNYS